MALSREDVKRLAELSRLALTEEEMERMEQTLDPVLEYVGRLAKLDTSGVPEAEEWSDALPPLRADEAHRASPETRKAILSNFPDKAGDALRVPGVFEKPKG
ncbi:Asp-tRNA(Asn)/Glu-tRNA(Gln) amidotransferase subunit GatC [Candidatus Uhrbacteria bacterium]|nr:Asp-tRNA(Asn)/Glu-tRNA(Gln) amidotransferase subunit GatC [Candidatus Uhrbacteria bacterium]